MNIYIHSYDNPGVCTARYGDALEFAQAKAFTSLPCVLPLQLNTDLRQLAALVCEGRRLHAVTAMGESRAIQRVIQRAIRISRVTRVTRVKRSLIQGRVAL